LNIALVMKNAVKSDSVTPTDKVTANPLIGPVAENEKKTGP
jgi:hypothetical protein